MNARSVFIGGTASHAGKSWFTAAICRYLRNRGLRVAPFKAQNMSNNSGPCRISVKGSSESYGEIGRAQIAQAEACGLEPETDMNPILLKPHSDVGSQVIVNGRVWQDLSASAYYDQFSALLSHVLDAFNRLASRHDVIVIEGAGSVAEVNLKSRDLVNFGLAERIGAKALLVADIDRGGVFGSIVGTMSLLTDDERALVRSFAVNRFRGDPALFHDGVTFLEHETSRPCIGVFPYAHDIRLDDEDGVSLDDKTSGGVVAILRFPHVSNFTDFDRIAGVKWLASPDRKIYDTVILPGTKNTTGDLRWLRQQGLDKWLLQQHAAGATLIGVCGGYQMLGEDIDGEPGLGLLPVETVMKPEKTVRPVTAEIDGSSFVAYEIHMGQTSVPAECTPFALIEGRPEGIRHGRCFGTYLHDAFNSDVVIRRFGLEATARVPPYDQLASWFASHANVKLFEELYL
jgi:adenosylcobyric acid synthase